MRACAYFYMVRLWGPVIIIEDNDKVVANPMQPLHREEDVLEPLFVTSLMQSRIFLKWQPPKDVNAWVQKACLPKVYARSGLERRHTRQRRPGESQGTGRRRDKQQRHQPLRKL